MIEIKQTGFSAGVYKDTEYLFDVRTDLPRAEMEKEVRKWITESKLPCRNREEWLEQSKDDPGIFFGGYYKLGERKDGGWNLRIILPSAE